MRLLPLQRPRLFASVLHAASSTAFARPGLASELRRIYTRPRLSFGSSTPRVSAAGSDTPVLHRAVCLTSCLAEGHARSTHSSMSGYQSLADAGRESPQPVAAPLPAPIGDGDPLDAPWRKHLATRGLTRVPDGSTPACMICGKHFNFLLRRRHHCRRCGACVCDGCSNHRLPLRFCQGHDGPDSVQRAAASLDREAVEGYVRACSRCAAVVDARIRGRVARRTSAPPPATTNVGVVDEWPS